MHRNKLLALALIAGFVVIGSAFLSPPSATHTNLKVLPQDISPQRLDSIMQTYNVALGVNCKFCHVSYPGFPDNLDYASDAEPMKEQARKMMLMNITINKTYFYFDKNERPEYLKTVTCNTCHRGEAFPEQK